MQKRGNDGDEHTGRFKSEVHCLMTEMAENTKVIVVSVTNIPGCYNKNIKNVLPSTTIFNIDFFKIPLMTPSFVDLSNVAISICQNEKKENNF